MYNSENKKKLENNGEFLVLHKETMVNYFFISVLVISFALFIGLLVNGLVKMNRETYTGIDGSLMATYTDEFLNISYAVPGENWVMAEVDTTEISETVDASKGSDGYFSIEDDELTEEVLSCICFTEAGETEAGYLQFMSFTFKPDVTYVGDEFKEFCESDFQRSLESSGEYLSYELTSSVEDESGGILMKAKIVQTVQVDDENGEKVESDEATYYTQYVKRVGKNIATATYGCIIEDNTVDEYLQYFISSIVTEKSLIS